MKKIKSKKAKFIQISLSLSLMLGFIISLPFSIIVFLPFLQKLGPNPNIFVVLLVVLPILIVIAIICGYISLSFCLLIWRPLLNKAEVEEYIYKQILFRKGLLVRKKDFRLMKKNVFKKPHYLISAILLFIAYGLDLIYRKIIETIFVKDTN